MLPTILIICVMSITQSKLTIERNVPYTPKGQKIIGVLQQLAAMKKGESFKVPVYDSSKFYGYFSRLRKETSWKAKNHHFAGQMLKETDKDEFLLIRFWRIN